MPREVSNTKPHILRINDALSGDVISFFYRLPTASERMQYRKSMLSVRGSKIVNKVAEVQLEFGKKIITGFAESSTGVDGTLQGGFVNDGKPFSSDQQSKNYRADWMDLIIATSSDMVSQVSAVVFDGTGIDQSGPADDGDEEKNLSAVSVTA